MDEFSAIERRGWAASADHYDDHFGRHAIRAVPGILDALGPLQGRRLLEVCCGTGHLARAAAARGALAEGLDFSPNMVARAVALHPALSFHQGDAQALPFDDGSFAAVACGFGLMHLPDADRGIAEACRVLGPGGRYAFTVWCSPEQGNGMNGMLAGIIAEHGDPAVELPAAPPVYRLADPDEARRAMAAAGFREVAVDTLDIVAEFDEPDGILEMIRKSTVRLAMTLAAQPPAHRARIEREIPVAAEGFRRADGRIRFAHPARLVSGTRV